MVQPNLVTGFHLSRRETSQWMRTRDSATSWRRGGGQRKGAHRCSQHCCQVWALQLVHWCLDFSLNWGADAGWSEVDKHQSPRNIIHWWVMNPYKVKAGCCGWKMLNNCVFISYKAIPICIAKEHFQPAVFLLLGQMLSFDYFPLMFFKAVAFLN